MVDRSSRSRRAPCLALPLVLLSLLILLIVGGTGCASGGLRPDTATQDEISELKARVLELQRKAAVNEVELARLRLEVAEIQGRTGSRVSAVPAPRGSSVAAQGTGGAPARGTTTAPSGALAGDRTGAPESGPARREVTQVVEEADLEADEPPPPVTSRPAAPPARTPTRPTTAPAPVPQAVRPAVPAPTAPAPAPPPASGAGTGNPAVPASAAQALYDRGYTLYHQGHYVDAESSFQRFLQSQPTSELADNAQYWIGECRYARQDLRGALAAFRETVDRYPEGNKVPDAMLKAGQSLEALGDVEGARTTYREVSHRFPGTAAAAVADERRGKLH